MENKTKIKLEDNNLRGQFQKKKKNSLFANDCGSFFLYFNQESCIFV